MLTNVSENRPMMEVDVVELVIHSEGDVVAGLGLGAAEEQVVELRERIARDVG